MSSSEVIFKGNSRCLKDSALGWFLDTLEEEIHMCHSEVAAYEWLDRACKTWQEEWREMPPGCKDIELDSFLTDLQKQETFYLIVNKVLKKAEQVPEGPDFLVREITRIKELVDL